MEKEMMEELERQREQQRREELARQVTAVISHQSGARASKCPLHWHVTPTLTTI